MSNENPPRSKPEDGLNPLQRAKKAREAAELALAESRRRMPIARVEVVDSRIHDRREINAQLAEAAHEMIVDARERQEEARLAARAELAARTPREPQQITPSDSTDVPRRASARPRFADSAPRPADRASSLETVEGWRKMLEEITSSTAAAKKKDDLLPAEVQWEDDGPTEVIDRSGEHSLHGSNRGVKHTETSGPRDGRTPRQDLQRAQADVAAEVARRLKGTEVISPALIPPVQNAAVSQPGFFRRWGNRIGLLFGLAAAGGASVGMNEMMKGNTSVGIDTGDDSNRMAFTERGDTAGSADSADSGDTADSSVDSTDSTDTGVFESGDSATETSESGDTAVDSGDSNSLIDSRDSADSADASVDSTDSFDSGETASDSFTRGGIGEYRQDTADSGDSADSSDSRDSSRDTGLESGNETGDSGDSFRDSQDSARDSIDSFQDTNGDTGFDSADSGDSTQDSTLDSTGSTDSFDSGDSADSSDSTDSADSGDSFRDTRGGTGIDSADTALDSADSGVDSTDSTDTGLLDSADSSGSRDSFGGTGFDNDSADSGDTMAYGVARFGSQDSSDSGDTSAFQNTETSESGDSADSGDSAEAGDTGMPGETAVNTTVQPDMPPAPGGAAEGLEIPNTENFVRTWIENGEGISQAMLRLGVPIEQITQALDSVEVVIGSQVNTLRNILIDASEAKGNQIGMNIQQDSDGIIRSVEFYSVANPDHVLTGSEMAELAHFDALSVADAYRQIHMLEDQLDHMEPGIELYYSPLVIRIAEEDGPVQVRHITDGQHYYELTPDFLSALGVDFTKYDKSKKEFFHEVPGAPLTRRLFREIAAKESLPPIPR